MRGSAVRDAVIAAIEAITPDAQASGRDVFRHVDTALRDGLRAPDRVFVVDLTEAPNRADLLTVDALSAQYTVTVLYSAAGAATLDRVADDMERVDRALIRLHTQAADIYAAATQPLDIAEEDGAIEARIATDVIYRLTGVS